MEDVSYDSPSGSNGRSRHSVLILIVVEDGLVQLVTSGKVSTLRVLILIVVEDGLVQRVDYDRR